MVGHRDDREVDVGAEQVGLGEERGAGRHVLRGAGAGLDDGGDPVGRVGGQTGQPDGAARPAETDHGHPHRGVRPVRPPSGGAHPRVHTAARASAMICAVSSIACSLARRVRWCSQMPSAVSASLLGQAFASASTVVSGAADSQKPSER